MENKKRGNHVLLWTVVFIITMLAIFSLPVKADIETDNYVISPSEIVHTIEMGEISGHELKVTNKRNSAVNVKFEIPENMSRVILFDHDEMIIPSGETISVNYTIFGSGKNGTITDRVALLDGISQYVPASITILNPGVSEAVGSLLMEVDMAKDYILTGSKLKFVTSVHNLVAGTSFNLTLKYFITRANDTDNSSQVESSDSLIFDSESLYLEKSLSIYKEIDIPQNFTPSVYTLNVQADYINYSSTIKTPFTVDLIFYNKKLFGIIPLWIIMLVVGVGLVGFVAFKIIKRELEKRKRFHAKIDYKLLPKPGDRSIFLGVIAETNVKAYWDMDVLTVHSIVAGSTGGGKSIAGQDIVEECLIKNCAVVVFDPTAQWSGMLRKCSDKKMLSFYPKFGLKPKDARAFPGNIRAIKDAREIIDLSKYLKEGEIQVFTTNTLDPKDYDMFVANTIREVFRSNLHEFRGLRYLFVYDEIHRILPKFGGSGQGFIQIERGCREFRKWGIGILLISQVLGDFMGAIKANINSSFQMKTRDEGDLNRIKSTYGDEFIHALVKSPVGSGMVQNANNNRGLPYYITFRPIFHSVVRLTDEELDQYNKYNDIVDDLEYQLDQLEELKQDVFDLRLELKLSQDKIKSGNFNMVQIYLDGLTPRIDKIWKKVGKSPEKLVRKLVDMDEMKEAIEAAKKAKADAAAAEKEAGGGAAEPAVEEKKDEKEEEMDPEMVEANLESIDKLLEQGGESIGNADWNRVNELVMEIQNIPLPKDKVEKKDNAVKKLKDDMESKKKELEEEKKKEEAQAKAAEEAMAKMKAEQGGGAAPPAEGAPPAAQ